MAAFFLLNFLTFSLLLTSSHFMTFNTLDVASSIHQTINLFSIQNKHQQVQEPLTLAAVSANASLSVRIHPRVSLHSPFLTHKDYKCLTESRFSRETARVNSLISKAELAIRGISRADLKPVENELAAEDLQAPVSSGKHQGSGEYFSRIGVGSPAREFYMSVDTGSDVSWLQCQPCAYCYQQSDPIFSPSSSSTYHPLTCGSPLCNRLKVKECRSDKCLYQVAYGDGSYTVGEFATETMSFGPSGSLHNVALGCGHSNEGLFVGAAGLLGLCGGSLSIPSQIKATSFSYCLVDRDSFKLSTLEFNSARPSYTVSAPLVKNHKLDTFYYIGLTGFSVGGKVVSIPPSLFEVDDSGAGGVIVDSGTAITRLPTQAYESLRDAFTRLTQNLKSTSGVVLFDTCYDFSALSSVRVPTVAMHFTGGGSLNLPAKNYLIPVDSSGTFCFAFAKTASSMSIIGNVQQQGTRVHFDLARSEVAFAQNNC